MEYISTLHSVSHVKNSSETRNNKTKISIQNTYIPGARALIDDSKIGSRFLNNVITSSRKSKTKLKRIIIK